MKPKFKIGQKVTVVATRPQLKKIGIGVFHDTVYKLKKNKQVITGILKQENPWNDEKLNSKPSYYIEFCRFALPELYLKK